MNSNAVKIFFAGDFCSKPSTSLINVSDDVKKLIKDCDIRVVNFELPLKPDMVEPKKQTRKRFFQNDDAPSFLYNLGFNLFTIANNHLFDWDDEGYYKTKSYLGDNSFGAGLYDEAYKLKTMTVNGIKIGFYSLTYNSYKGVFSDCDNHSGLGCAYLHDMRVNHDIINAKKEVDYLFVLIHDGIEYIDVPLPETIAKYRDLIDFGADGIIGTHPHCPQGWEMYKDKPIFYSLGNFFSNSKDSELSHTNRPHWYEGRCVILTLDNGKITYDVINTCNINNVSIEIDNSENSKKHNEIICNYLQDKEEYNKYFVSILKKHYKQCLRLMGVNKISDEMLYLLQNNLRLSKIIRMTKKIKNG